MVDVYPSFSRYGYEWTKVVFLLLFGFTIFSQIWSTAYCVRKHNDHLISSILGILSNTGNTSCIPGLHTITARNKHKHYLTEPIPLLQSSQNQVSLHINYWYCTQPTLQKQPIIANLLSCITASWRRCDYILEASQDTYVQDVVIFFLGAEMEK